MPDYRFTPVQAITVPRTEERQTALDLPEGLPEPKPEEPGLIRKNFDLALNFVGEGIKQIPGATARFLGVLGENVIRDKQEEGVKNFGDDLDEGDLKDKIVSDRKKQQGAIPSAYGIKGWDGQGDVDDYLAAKETLRKSAIPTEKDSSFVTRANLHNIQKGIAFEEQVLQNKAWGEEIAQMANHISSVKRGNPQDHALVQGAYKTADLFDALGDFIISFESDYAKATKDGTSELMSENTINSPEELLTRQGLEKAKNMVLYGWEKPYAAMMLINQSLSSTVAQIIGSGKLMKGLEGMEAFGKLIRTLGGLGVPEKATRLILAGAINGQLDGMMTAMQNVADEEKEAMEKGKTLTREQAWGIFSNTYAMTAAWDTVTAGISPEAGLIARMGGRPVTQAAKKEMVGASSDGTLKRFAKGLLRGVGGVASGAAGEATQEIPQSAGERMITNYYMGRPLMEGVTSDGLMGGLTAAATGGGMHMMNRGIDFARETSAGGPEEAVNNDSSSKPLDGEVPPSDGAGAPPANGTPTEAIPTDKPNVLPSPEEQAQIDAASQIGNPNDQATAAANSSEQATGSEPSLEAKEQELAKLKEENQNDEKATISRHGADMGMNLERLSVIFLRISSPLERLITTRLMKFTAIKKSPVTQRKSSEANWKRQAPMRFLQV